MVARMYLPIAVTLSLLLLLPSVLLTSCDGQSSQRPTEAVAGGVPQAYLVFDSTLQVTLTASEYQRFRQILDNASWSLGEEPDIELAPEVTIQSGPTIYSVYHNGTVMRRASTGAHRWRSDELKSFAEALRSAIMAGQEIRETRLREAVNRHLAQPNS